MWPRFPNRHWWMALAAALAICPAATAQGPPLLDNLNVNHPLLRREHWLADLANPTVPGTEATSSSPRFRLYRMMPGFLSDPLGLDGGDDLAGPADDRAVAGRSVMESAEPNWLQVAIGQDNPWFDLRRPGDPGGIGYYRLYSQMQLADWGTTSICFGLQAVTPAGQQDGGYQNGPTIVTPAFSVFQDLGNGLAFQGFVGHHFRAALRDEMPENALNWGLGLQCPVPGINSRADQGFFLFMQALAYYNYDGYRANGRATNWELVPGVHYRLNSNCWMSLGASRNGMLTCSWQF